MGVADRRHRDAWAGGFVAGIVQGKSLEESIDMGHWLASLSIKELGPSYVVLDRYTLLQKLLTGLRSYPFPKQTYQALKA